MTGLYVFVNIMGARPEDPTPDQIACLCLAIRDGRCGNKAWEDSDYYRRAGVPTAKTPDGFEVPSQVVEIRTYDAKRNGVIEQTNTRLPKATRAEAKLRRVAKACQGAGT